MLHLLILCMSRTGETYVERVIKREDFTVELGGKCLASRSQLPIKLAWALVSLLTSF